jgi:hypothetical protein
VVVVVVVVVVLGRGARVRRDGGSSFVSVGPIKFGMYLRNWFGRLRSSLAGIRHRFSGAWGGCSSAALLRGRCRCHGRQGARPYPPQQSALDTEARASTLQYFANAAEATAVAVSKLCTHCDSGKLSHLPFLYTSSTRQA